MMLFTLRVAMACMLSKLWYALLVIGLLIMLLQTNSFADAIWFGTEQPIYNRDGSVSSKLTLCSENILYSKGNNVFVFGNEVPSKWKKEHHKGFFRLRNIAKEEEPPAFLVNSSHSIRYKVKAVVADFAGNGMKRISCAKVNLFLYGKRGFDPDQNEHGIVENKEFAFPFEIVDLKAALHYWIEAGHDFKIKLLFQGRPLANKKVRVFANNIKNGEFATDAQGQLKFNLPYPDDLPFKHTRDFCHYRIEAEHEQGNIVYSTTLTLIVHPERKNSNFIVGIYTLFGSLAGGMAFVVFKRKRYVME